MDQKECTGWLTRWQPRLMKINFEVVHHPGAHHQKANAVSRIPKPSLTAKENNEVDTYNDILIYRILEHVSNMRSMPQEVSRASSDASTTAGLTDAQQTDALCYYAARLI